MPVFKLLDGAAASTTGPTHILGQTPAPYTIRTSGAYATAGVDIETAPTAAGPWMTDFGMLGGPSVAEARVADAKALVTNTFVVIEHKVHFMRAKTAAAMTGTATVYLETQD